EQHPKPGEKIKQDGTVFLVVSKGSQMVTVPNLIGSHFQEALIGLRNLSLRSSVVDSLYSDTNPVDTVMRMSPSPGSKVEKNTLIRLYLSRGKEPKPDSLSYQPSYYY
ncbi:MAG TPA: PASTA domain-containing protein, partial [Candidatus Cloacimonadota bacterium]|nr:PASTA domain-containing protein [Candidatus Cloacimonadota bacterium]